MSDLWIVHDPEKIAACMETWNAFSRDTVQAPSAYERGEDYRDCGLSATVNDGVAVVEVRGPLVARIPDFWRYMGVNAVDLGQAALLFSALYDDPAVDRVQVLVDTPGGTVKGTDALATVIRDGGKPLAVHVDGMMASGGVWAFAFADTITAERTALVGSVGVYSVIYDDSSAYENCGIKVHVVSSGGIKGQGVSGTKISDAKLEAEQVIIESLNLLFRDQLADGRGFSEEQLDIINTGEVWVGAKAQELGLIDEVTEGPVSMSTDQRKTKEKESLMNYVQLIAENVAFAAELRAMSEAAKPIEEAQSALKELKAAAAQEQAEAKATEAEAKAAEMQAKAAEAEDKAQKLQAEVDTLKAKVAEMGGVIAAQENDPGHQEPGGGGETMKAEAYEALPMSERMAIQREGKIQIVP